MAKTADPKRLNLALQGGGSHGAYTWGTLDRLLEEEHLTLRGLSGTSAGAMNAAMLVSGYRKNGRAGAKKALADFWLEVSRVGGMSNPVQSSMIDQMQHRWNLDNTFSYQAFDLLTRMFSPYRLNPFNLNPLRDVLNGLLDPELLHRPVDDGLELFVTATDVHTGRARVFRGHEITVDALLASACVPFFFQSVEIDGVPYWDGGYMGNPSLWPLIYYTDVHDLLLVQINPICRRETPKSAHEIINRMNEINFNSGLIHEIRAINFVGKLVREHKLDAHRYKDIHVHMIAGPSDEHDLNASSKLNTDPEFFTFLHDLGYAAADRWLKTHTKDIGVRGSVHLEEVFLGQSPEA